MTDTTTHDGAARPQAADFNAHVASELINALNASRAAADAQQLEMSRERTRERRWRTVSRVLFVAVPALVGLVYALAMTGVIGGDKQPRAEVVGVVRVAGEIGAEQDASARHIIPALKRAFESPKTRAVVLSIDSPGGAPLEAERINNAIALLKKKHPKPLYAVINSVGASAAYMVAMHADKVYAGRYSLVGSVGAIMSAWQAEKAMERLGVSQRVYASGALKSMLNPFEPISSEADAKARALVQTVGQTFVAELKERRGTHLKPDVDYGTGEMWSGEEARALGLVDELGTLDQVVQASWGVEMHDFGPRRDDLGIFGPLMQRTASEMARLLADEAQLRLR